MAELFTLDNGLRIITDVIDSVDTASFGLWVNVGTRHEDINFSGAAHMVEHMLFKGTKRRNALDISAAIENVGGHMNAYTGREMTAYYSHLLQEDLDLAIDVIGDMVLNSTMPSDEIERERGVILQEIKMYLDTPDDLVMDYFSEAAYPAQSLGANGLGDPAHIKAMSRETLMDYVDTKYAPNNFVVSVAGRIDPDRVIKQIQADFGRLKGGTPAHKIPAHYSPQDKIVAKDTEQTHIMVGFEAPHRYHADYPVMRVLSTLLGGGMSSRLFQEIREKRGLVYSISSSYDVVSDHAIFGFYAGTGAEHVKELMPAALGEFKKLAQDFVSPDELKRAKAQIKTSVLMSRERVMTRTDQNARSVLHYGTPYNAQKFIATIDAVTMDDICRVMGDVLKTRAVVASVGATAHIINGENIEAFVRA